jgi:hypothetical protein
LGVLICLISVDMVRGVDGLVPMDTVDDGAPDRKETRDGLCVVVVGDGLELMMLFVALVVMRRRA